ncbi:MAG: hypothetical protein JO256_03530 [Alphaproteobacteria bacterium]|nr:hypothetical protein [Alphaproteobacteria bacterium]
MSHLFEPDETVPILKLLERWSGEENTYAVGAEPINTHTWHINQVILGPECRTLAELEQVAAKIRADLDRMLAEAKIRINVSQA